MAQEGGIVDFRDSDSGSDGRTYGPDDLGECDKITFQRIFDDFQTAISGFIFNAHMGACCGFCAMTSHCELWFMVPVALGQPTVCIGVRGLTGGSTPIHSPEIAMGETRIKNSNTLSCWAERGWRNIFADPIDPDETLVAPVDSDEDCCNECKARLMTATDPAGCTYWTYHKPTKKCFLWDNTGLAGREQHNDWVSGYITLHSVHTCKPKLGVSYLGPNLYHAPAYPITAAQCCHFCKTTPACKAWTWDPYIADAEKALLYDPRFTGVCFLKSRQGRAVRVNKLVISGIGNEDSDSSDSD
jgi:hypothetical protein